METRSSDEGGVAIRTLEPGDIEWAIERHGAIYAEEFGWNSEFEDLVAEILTAYEANHRPGREQAWIATVDGARAGCVFCCQLDAETAQLRTLVVEPWARGLGLGRTLVSTCVDFARTAGYADVVLWTNHVLVAARRIYEAAGFTLEESEPHRSFGADLVGQTWRLSLGEPTSR
ncbi:MAG: GNAT family N-acetyltransferase [Actinomycetota bacterium]